MFSLPSPSKSFNVFPFKRLKAPTDLAAHSHGAEKKFAPLSRGIVSVCPVVTYKPIRPFPLIGEDAQISGWNNPSAKLRGRLPYGHTKISIGEEGDWIRRARVRCKEASGLSDAQRITDPAESSRSAMSSRFLLVRIAARDHYQLPGINQGMSPITSISNIFPKICR